MATETHCVQSDPIITSDAAPRDSQPAAQSPGNTSPQRWQFNIRSLLWLTFIAAMFLGYVRLMDPEGLPVVVLMPLIAAVMGMGLGSLTGRRQTGAYWAAIGTVLGVICVMAVRLPQLTFWFWPLLGAIAGGYAGAYRPAFNLRTLAIAVAIGVGLFVIFFAPLGRGASELLVDLVCAPVVCEGLIGLVALVEWLHERYRTPRDLWAAGLVFAVIAGNLVAGAISRAGR